MTLPLHTGRQVRAQVLLCQGCCCGRVDRGRPPVPIDWIKQQWKELKLAKHVQLTVSGCLGPCDVPNIVLLLTPSDQIWLGRLTDLEHYQPIVDWAARFAHSEQPADLPESLYAHRLDPFADACPSIAAPAAS
ncbi:MAG TPA: (2Fe-2S) ferredoxin domain-containing protein [Phycisphaerae bacterium]|nr:(2Fe-2S) ferredoxin domain-containing protein [Phycisphaerae bacterium]